MYSTIKSKLIVLMKERIEDKIQMIQNAIILAKESRDSDCKCTVGDKYETGRAMMHIEIQNKENQLAQVLELKKGVQNLLSETTSDVITFGSYVLTNYGNYYISVALGELKIEDLSCFAISLASPLGKVFVGKKKEDQFSFNGRAYHILDIA